MKKTLIMGAVAAILAAPAFAEQPATLDRVMKELEALSGRVTKLEQENGQLSAQNAELKEKNDRLEATTEYLRANATATRKELAEDGPKVDAADKAVKATEWASRISWKGDVRYRHENVDPEEAVTDQTRHRIRARFGLSAKVSDTLSATVQLATTGGLNTTTNQTDPRSTNQTLGQGWDRKAVGIDLAYIDWKPLSSLNLQFGKMPQPWQRTASYFWDGDITPEGIAAKFSSGPFFGSAFGYYLSERSTAADATLLGAQIGMTGTVGAAKLTGAIGYFDVGAVLDEVTTTNATIGCTANAAFFNGAQGNTTITDLGGCSHLANDFNMIDALAQAEFKVGVQPLTIFAEYIQNQEADDLDKGYSAGVVYGKAADPHTWEVGYTYGKMEKDAQFGQFVDSDFGGGITDVDGSVFKVGYAIAKNWVLNGTYFKNKRFIDATGATQRDYDRYQIDLNLKF